VERLGNYKKSAVSEKIGVFGVKNGMFSTKVCGLSVKNVPFCHFGPLNFYSVLFSRNEKFLPKKKYSQDGMVNFLGVGGMGCGHQWPTRGDSPFSFALAVTISKPRAF